MSSLENNDNYHDDDDDDDDDDYVHIWLGEYYTGLHAISDDWGAPCHGEACLRSCTTQDRCGGIRVILEKLEKRYRPPCRQGESCKPDCRENVRCETVRKLQLAHPRHFHKTFTRVQWHSLLELFERVRRCDPTNPYTLGEFGDWYRSLRSRYTGALRATLACIENYFGQTTLLSAWLGGQSRSALRFDATAWREHEDNEHYARAVLTLHPMGLDEEKAFLDAAERGSLAQVAVLAARMPQSGGQALAAAAAAGHHEVVGWLLEDLADDAVANHGGRALQDAAQYGHHRVVAMLLGHVGVDVAGRGAGALRLALAGGSHETMRMLLAHPELDLAVAGSAILFEATRRADLTVVRLLLLRADIGAVAAGDALVQAAQDGHVDVLRALLTRSSAGPDNGRVQYALTMAAVHGHHESADTLLQHPAVAHVAQDNRLLRHVIIEDDGDMVAVFLEHAADRAAMADQSLVYAAMDGSPNVARMLVRDYEDMGVAGYGGPALVEAATNNHDTIVELLLETEGVDVAGYGGPALVQAARNGQEDRVVQLLLETEGVDVAGYGGQALVEAARMGGSLTVEVLLRDNRVDVAEEGGQALEEAAAGGHDKAVAVMLGQELPDMEYHVDRARDQAAGRRFKRTVQVLDDWAYRRAAGPGQYDPPW